jgi:hypothetical protein
MHNNIDVKKGKAVPVTGRGGPKGCETLRLPHFLDNRLTDGDKVDSLFFLFGLWGYWHCGHSWPIVPASCDSEDDCGEADGM